MEVLKVHWSEFNYTQQVFELELIINLPQTISYDFEK